MNDATSRTSRTGWMPTNKTYDQAIELEFSKMDEAFRNAGEHLVVHRFETRARFGDKEGVKHRYFVGSWETLERRILRTPRNALCCHEILRHERPCRLLAVDLDFDRKKWRSSYSDQVLVKEAIDAVLSGLETLLTPEEIDDVTYRVLSASNDLKFSYHLLFEIRGGLIYWDSNLECGKFVLGVVDALEKDSPLFLSSLRGVKGEETTTTTTSSTSHATNASGERTEEKKHCVIDTQIYGQNHSLRMYRSIKLDQGRPLVDVECPWEGNYDNPIDREKLRWSWISYFPETFEFGRARAIVLPEDPRLQTGPKRRGEVSTPARKTAPFRGEASSWTSRHDSGSQDDTYVPSEALELVRACLEGLGESSGEELSMLYDTDKWKFHRRKWCLSVPTFSKRCRGREHTTNHSRWVFDLRQGIFYRQCFSDSCGKAKNDLVIPSEALQKRMTTLYLVSKNALDVEQGFEERSAGELWRFHSGFRVDFREAYSNFARRLKEAVPKGGTCTTSTRG